MSELSQAIASWLEEHHAVVIGAMAASIVMLIVSVAVAVGSFVRMPADYFCEHAHENRKQRTRKMHPVRAMIWIVFRNVIGWALILAGIIMLVAPGQGILTILIGILLIDFPGKRNVEVWLIRKPSIHRSINWLRRKYDRHPIELPDAK